MAIANALDVQLQGGTGTGSFVGSNSAIMTSPTITSASLITPNLGTPTAGNLVSCTNLPIGSGVAGLASGMATFLETGTSANLLAAITNPTGTGLAVFNNGPTLIAPNLGTPASGNLSNCTGVPSGGITGIIPVANGGTGSGTPSLTAFNNITGFTAAGTTGLTSSNLVFSSSPAFTTPNIGTPTAGTLTLCTGLPLTTGVTGVLPYANGGLNSALTSANSAVLVTNNTGVAQFSTPLTNGQVIIGSTGNAPVAGNLSSGAGISISNSAGGITISATGGGIGWVNVTTTTQALSSNLGYAINSATLCTLTLPAAASIGDVINIRGSGAGGWIIAQNAGQNIQVGNVSSTIGTGGTVASTNRYDCFNLTCVVANTTFVVNGSQSSGFTIV